MVIPVVDTSVNLQPIAARISRSGEQLRQERREDEKLEELQALRIAAVENPEELGALFAQDPQSALQLQKMEEQQLLVDNQNLFSWTSSILSSELGITGALEASIANGDLDADDEQEALALLNESLIDPEGVTAKIRQMNGESSAWLRGADGISSDRTQSSNRLANGYFQRITGNGSVELISPDNQVITDPEQVSAILEDAHNKEVQLAGDKAFAKSEGKEQGKIKTMDEMTGAEQKSQFALDETKVVAGIRGMESKRNIIAQEIQRARVAIEKGKAGGWSGLLADMPNNVERTLQNIFDTIKANVGFQQLEDMRAASKTGAALGQVTENELRFLQSVLGALDNLDSADSMLTTLNSIERRFDSSLASAKKEYRVARDRFKSDQSLSDDNLTTLLGDLSLEEPEKPAPKAVADMTDEELLNF